MPSKRRIGIVALVFFLGVIVGSVVGEIISLLLPEGNVFRDLFVAGKDFVVEPMTIDLIVFTFTVGFSITVNLVSVLGIVVVGILLRMYV